MKTIVTITVVDEHVSPQSTQSKCIDGDKIIVRIGTEFVAIPMCDRMPTYIKRGRTFYKLEQTAGTFRYNQTWHKPRSNARIVEAEELWEQPRDAQERDKLSESREAIGTLIRQLLWLRHE